jgi:hypothetical protein
MADHCTYHAAGSGLDGSSRATAGTRRKRRMAAAGKHHIVAVQVRDCKLLLDTEGRLAAVHIAVAGRMQQADRTPELGHMGKPGMAMVQRLRCN